jgi:hypothetical protein
MTVVLDAGALIRVERGDREVLALLNVERLAGRPPRTHGGVVGQVWRSGPRQARLSAFLPGVLVVGLDDGLGRRAGALLGAAERADVIDAALVLLAEDGDDILTSDPDDLTALAVVAGTHVELVRV